jgi:hypothetical protein
MIPCHGKELSIGGSAGAIGTGIAIAAGVTLSGPLAGIIGGYVAIHMGSLSLQLKFNDYAVTYI